MRFFDDDDDDFDFGSLFGSDSEESNEVIEEPVVTEEQFPAESSTESSGSWICSCGQENVGDFCVACGKPKGSVEDSATESSTESSDSWICSCGQENVGDFCVACGKPKGYVEDSATESSTESSGSWICSCGQENVGDFCVACGKPKGYVEDSSTESSSNEDSERRRHSSRSSHQSTQQTFTEQSPQQQSQPEPQPEPQPPPQQSPPPPAPENSSGSNKAVILGAIAGVLLLGGGGFFAWQHFQNNNPASDEFALTDNKPTVETGNSPNVETGNTPAGSTENNSSENTTVVANYYVVRCNTSVTLRRAPAITSVELAQVPLGQAVGFIEETNNEFCKVNYNGTIGYILTEYLSAQSPASAQNQPAPIQNQPASNNSATLNLGGVQLGDSLEKVHQVFGKEDRITGKPPEIKIEYRNIVVYYDNIKVTGLVSYSPAVKTERNIHEGSSLNDVIAAYGRRCSVQNYEGTLLYEYPYENQQGGLSIMRFAIKNGVVDYISLRTVNDPAEKSKILSTVKTI